HAAEAGIRSGRRCGRAGWRTGRGPECSGAAGTPGVESGIRPASPAARAMVGAGAVGRASSSNRKFISLSSLGVGQAPGCESGGLDRRRYLVDRGSSSCETDLEVGKDIVDVLDPDGQADQPGGDPGSVLLLP